jgi:hypothetical protein
MPESATNAAGTNSSGTNSSGTVADIDAFLAAIETPGPRAEIDRLGEIRLPLAAIDRLYRALAALRTAVSGPAGALWHDLQLLGEAVELARFDGHSLDVQGLLLLETRAIGGREGTLTRGQRYLDALRALTGVPPRLSALTTAYLQIDRDPSHWPRERSADRGCQAVSAALSEVEAILDADGAGIVRLFTAYRRMLSIKLPEPDGLPGSSDDDPGFRALLATALEPADTVGALASMMLGLAVARLGLLDRPAWFVTRALRTTPPPADGGDKAAIGWFAAAIADAADRAAERARDIALQLEVLEARLSAIGGRDRKRSVLFAALVRHPIITAGRLAAITGVSNRAALTFCDLMVEHGIARHIGRNAGHRLVSVDLLVR